MRLLSRIAVNAIALAAAIWLVAGISLTGDTAGQRVTGLLVVAVVFGVVNAVVRPVLKFLASPFILLTLGLLLVVINALMLLLTSWLSGQIGLGFEVDGFWTAVVGAMVVSVVSWLTEIVLPSAD
jgi:putative membrane protein